MNTCSTCYHYQYWSSLGGACQKITGDSAEKAHVYSDTRRSVVELRADHDFGCVLHSEGGTSAQVESNTPEVVAGPPA